VFATSTIANAQPILLADSFEAVGAQTGRQPDAKEGEAPGKITLEFKDADIKTVLRILSIKSGLNIVAGEEVKGAVTIRLTNVEPMRALRVVLKTYNYVFEKDGNIVRVTTVENLALEPLETEIFVLNYSTAAEVADAVSELLSERGRVKAVNRTNVVIVTDVASTIYKIGQVVKHIDKQTPQAAIDAKIIETKLEKSENLGIDWTFLANISGAAMPHTAPFKTGATHSSLVGFPPTGAFFPISGGAGPTASVLNPRDWPVLDSTAATIVGQTYQLGTLNFNQFTAALQFLNRRENTKIISNPRIVVLNNQTAQIQVGQEIGIPTFELNEQTGVYVVTGFDMRDVGVVLNVTPHINDNNEIMVEVKPEVSSIVGATGFVAIGGTNLASPQFNVTQAYTQVLIKNGETIAIGGLITDNRVSTYTRVPFLSKIPWFGKAFKAKREVFGTPGQNVKSETIFFITVSIVDTEGQPTRELSVASDIDPNTQRMATV